MQKSKIQQKADRKDGLILGIDRALGAQLAIRYMPSGVQALENVLAGDAHFAGVGFSVMPTFVTKGRPVVAPATLSSGTPPYAVLVRNDLAKTIRSMKDLKGRSIGIPLGSATTRTYLQILMELSLESYGVKSNQVRWVPTNMNFNGMYGALAGGAVDAVFCEEPLSRTLVRKQIGTLLASLSDPKNPARIVGRQHLRAVVASTPDIVTANPHRAEQMVRHASTFDAVDSQDAPRGCRSQAEYPGHRPGCRHHRCHPTPA